MPPLPPRKVPPGFEFFAVCRENGPVGFSVCESSGTVMTIDDQRAFFMGQEEWELQDSVTLVDRRSGEFWIKEAAALNSAEHRHLGKISWLPFSAGALMQQIEEKRQSSRLNPGVL